MSMPSSSDEVATSARSAPAFSRSSTSTRCGRAIDPWCERTSVSPASSFSAPASRSASRRLLTKISVERCARISSSSRGWIADQIDGRASPTDAGPLGMSSAVVSLRHVLDRHLDGQLQRLLRAGVDDGDRPVADGAAVRGELVGDLGVGLRVVGPCDGCARPSAPAPALRDERDRRVVGAAEKPRHFVERPLRRRQADALRRPLAAAPRAARATARGARRAWSAPARGSRR